MRLNMKPALIIVMCMLLLAGCAHLEVPSDNTYPFRAEFDGNGMIDGMKMRISGSLYLTSMKTGTVEIYGPGGMASYTIDIDGNNLILKDMWGKKTDEISLPLNDIAGLFAGDVPRGTYLYNEKTSHGMKVAYHWGKLNIDDKTLPNEVNVNCDPPLKVIFTPKEKFVIIDAFHGSDTIRIKLMIRQGGRWFST
jgi:hypothetical protein